MRLREIEARPETALFKEGLLDEYILLNSSYNPPAPKLSLFDIVDRRTGDDRGDILIGVAFDQNSVYVAAIINQRISACLEFLKADDSGNYFFFKSAVAYEKGKGLATTLFDWFKRTYRPGSFIFSDTRITVDGLKFWKSIMARYSSSVVNLRTLKKYEISDIGKYVDGVLVLDPADDNRSNEDLYTLPSDPNAQQWFYMVESKRNPKRVVEWFDGTVSAVLVHRDEVGDGFRRILPRTGFGVGD